jgi:hypothetical protein
MSDHPQEEPGLARAGAPSHDFTPPPLDENTLGMGKLTPTCPLCGCRLHPLRHLTGIAWRCSSCGGQSLNFSQFRRLIPEHNAREIWLDAMLHPDAPSHPLRCPECRRQMCAVFIPLREKQIELALCQACQRLWLEPQEDTRTLRVPPE